MKTGIAIGAASVIVGLALMTTEQTLCRTSCWMNNMLGMFLPESYDFLGRGLPAVVIGIAIIIHAVWSGKKR